MTKSYNVISPGSLTTYKKTDQGRICGQMQDVSTGKGKSSYYSAMPRARGLKFYYVIADLKVTSDFTHDGS